MVERKNKLSDGIFNDGGIIHRKSMLQRGEDIGTYMMLYFLHSNWNGKHWF